jgi:phosphodiesterase/alkaline phosphatase D-like protein
VSSRRSSTEPYYVCPRESDRPQCELIEDPTRGSDDRGPVSAGAITSGPALEVSPALYGNGVEGGYSPENLRSAYELEQASESVGSGQTVAIVDAYDDPNAESDLKVYRSKYRLPACTTSDGCFRKVNETGGTSYPAANEGWATEIALDLDMVSAICPNCHILLVEASSNEDGDLAAAENEAAALGATEISNSFGGPTLSEPPEDASAYDHPGIPITAAGGDHGYGVESPASNPHVIAVGGTTLVPAKNSRGWTETVWYRLVGGEPSGTGSGCSKEPKPAWQTDRGCAYRTTNDVAAVADPNTPVSTYDSYGAKGWQLLGGTSVATPIIAAAMALANPYTKAFEGAKALYLEAATNGTGALDDVVSGSNGSCGTYLCEAGPGYDGPTGLGSLDGVPEAQPPTLVTDGATSIKQTEATLNATVDPDGAEVDECRFEYGTTTSYGSSASCSALPGSGTSPVAVSASVAGLATRTTYHFRIALGYPGGSGAGGDRTFTTLPNAPAVVTGEATHIEGTSATLNATVNPNGGTVSSCQFEYGTTVSYGKSVACASLPGFGESAVAVSASPTGLTVNTTYHFRIVATNEVGTSYGSDETLKTLPNAPTPVTSEATHVGSTSATLSATVDPNGGTVSACRFEYGTTVSYGSSAPCASLPGSGESAVAVSASTTGLTANTTYYFRIVATNAGGTSHGSAATFETLPNAPSVVTKAPSSLTQTAATLNATVNPNGGTVSSCNFEYGASTSYGSSVPCASPAGSGNSPVSVSASITGLTANTTYHLRIVATNAGGTSYGSDETFETLPNVPTVVTGEPSAVTQTSATVSAVVSPNGWELDECWFEYGTSESGTSEAYVPCATLPESTAGATVVTASVDGLAAGTTYVYRISAGDSSGASYGAIQEFTTVPVAALEPAQLLSPIVESQPTLPLPPQSSPTVPDAQLASTTLAVSSGGVLAVAVRCPTGESSCIGMITLRTLSAVSAGTSGHQATKRILTLASAPFTVAGGGVERVKLHLSVAARRLLARWHILRARVTILTRDATGAAGATQATVTIHTPEATHSRKG